MSPRKKKPTITRMARSVYFPEPMHEWLTDEANRTGVSVNAIILMAVEAWQRSRGAAAPTHAPPPAPMTPDDDGPEGFN